MAEVTLETLAKRVEALERKLAHQAGGNGKDWRQAAGLFTGSEVSPRVDEEAKTLREADRAAARREFGE